MTKSITCKAKMRASIFWLSQCHSITNHKKKGGVIGSEATLFGYAAIHIIPGSLSNLSHGTHIFFNQ